MPPIDIRSPVTTKRAVVDGAGSEAGFGPDLFRGGRQDRDAESGRDCLAHLAREVAFGCEAGEDHLPALLKIWFGRVFDLAGRIGEMAGGAIAVRRQALEKELDRLLKTATACPIAKALQAKLEREKHQIMTFSAFPGEVETTNIASERYLRPGVIARKFTNGYRAKWATDNEAAMRTTIDTARLKGATPYQISQMAGRYIEDTVISKKARIQRALLFLEHASPNAPVEAAAILQTWREIERLKGAVRLTKKGSNLPLTADSDEAGRAFPFDAGHLFRFEAGRFGLRAGIPSG